MKPHSDMRGGFPVTAFEALPEGERLLVKALRHWSAGPDGAARIGEMLQARMGGEAASACHRALNDVMGIIARHGRRKMVRHQLHCSCVGADEAVFAHFVTLAARGEREDAMLVGSLMVEGQLLLPFTEAARQVGLHLHRADLAGMQRMPDMTGATVH